MKKEGSAYDLPLALGILGALGHLDSKTLLNCLFIGELSLNGELKPVPGALSISMMAKDNGIKKIFAKAKCKRSWSCKGHRTYPSRFPPGNSRDPIGEKNRESQ